MIDYVGKKVKIMRPVDNALNHLKLKIGDVVAMQDTDYPLLVQYDGEFGPVEMKIEEVDFVD